MILSRIWRHTKSIPRRDAIPLQFALSTILFKPFEGHSESIIEFGFGDITKLRFRIVNVIDVDTIDAHILQRLFELTLKVFGRHAVNTTNKILEGGNTGFDKSGFDVITNIARLSPVKG